MVAANLIAAMFALIFLLVNDKNLVWLAYLASILLTSSATFFGPAFSASIPNIVSSEELFAANALSSASWGIMVMVGSALGGIISAAFGRDFAFIINALSFILASGLIWTVKIPSPQKTHTQRLAPWRDFVEGLHYLRSYLPAVGLVMVKAGWGLGGGVLVLLSVFGQKVFNAGDAGIGALYAARGLGALVGPLLVQMLVKRNVDKMRTAIWISCVVSAGGYALFGLAGWLNSLVLACIVVMFAHLGGGSTWVISAILLQQTTPDHLRGRVLAVDYGLSTLTTSLATLSFGLVLETGFSPMLLALIGAALFLSFGIFWAIITAQGRLEISTTTINITNKTLTKI
jgi:MFS family permease